jgi:hypothetical protein
LQLLLGLFFKRLGDFLFWHVTCGTEVR